MTAKATRRRFTAAYKRSVVTQADACTGRGELGALLRREGIYASTLAKFRKQVREGQLEPGAPIKRRASKDPAVVAVFAQQAELERDVRDLRRKLAHAERIIAIQKKAAILLGEALQDMSLDEPD
jgi:transposase-like protein